MKLFIVNNIYRKYPKVNIIYVSLCVCVCVCVCCVCDVLCKPFHVQVQEEFDSVDRMWKALPTDAELLERQSLTQEQAVSTHHTLHPHCTPSLGSPYSPSHPHCAHIHPHITPSSTLHTFTNHPSHPLTAHLH